MATRWTLVLLVLVLEVLAQGPLRDDLQKLCEDRKNRVVMPQCPPVDESQRPVDQAPPDPEWLEKALVSYCSALGGHFFQHGRCLWGNLPGGSGPR